MPWRHMRQFADKLFENDSKPCGEKSLNSRMSVSLWHTNVTVKWHHDDVFNHFSMNYVISFFFSKFTFTTACHDDSFLKTNEMNWIIFVEYGWFFLNNNKNKNNSNKCWYILFWNTCIQNPLPRLVRFIGMLMQYISLHNELFHRN